jgi:hypothetical protein
MMSPPTSPALSAGVSGAVYAVKGDSSVVVRSIKPVDSQVRFGLNNRGRKSSADVDAIVSWRNDCGERAAPTKKTSSATNTHAIPLIRRRFRRAGGAQIAAAGTVEPSNRTVQYIQQRLRLDEIRQLRQKRSSEGIAEWAV